MSISQVEHPSQVRYAVIRTSQKEQSQRDTKMRDRFQRGYNM